MNKATARVRGNLERLDPWLDPIFVEGRVGRQEASARTVSTQEPSGQPATD
jgi:hypothetical protein